ncbi:MAG TPA: response regulator [Candidatus Deferrimicrobium sp.]|nr:response regulator [Candidatus Deferrimicrobium sp.]
MKKDTKILVVDDDSGMCETLADILNEIGYSTNIANNGYQAIEMTKNDNFNIVLMDIKMPNIDGVETFKQMKLIRPSMKVIMMTAYTKDSLVEKAFKEGAYEVFDKPLDMDKLVNLIEKIEKQVPILIVDDNPAFCETLKDVLTENSYRVAIANSGEQAINCVKENQFDIIFIDINMPISNGFEIYLAIKKINPEIIAIMMTGFKEEVFDLIDNAINKNAYTCLYKPLELDEVIHLIEKICRIRLRNK